MQLFKVRFPFELRPGDPNSREHYYEIQSRARRGADETLEGVAIVEPHKLEAARDAEGFVTVSISKVDFDATRSNLCQIFNGLPYTASEDVAEKIAVKVANLLAYGQAERERLKLPTLDGTPAAVVPTMEELKAKHAELKTGRTEKPKPEKPEEPESAPEPEPMDDLSNQDAFDASVSQDDAAYEDIEL